MPTCPLIHSALTQQTQDKLLTFQIDSVCLCVCVRYNALVAHLLLLPGLSAPLLRGGAAGGLRRLQDLQYPEDDILPL